MFTSKYQSANAYHKVGIQTGVVEANPHKLIMMLFDGGMLALSNAMAGLRDGDLKKKGESVSWAIDIISQGLQSSLNLENGGEIAEKLNSLYDYMCMRLLHANAHNDQAALEEVARLLGEIRSAWEEIASDPAVVSASSEAA
jgi:flagellar protein FliS